MHNLVHTFVNGTWFDIANSPNDPLFWFHHSFVDKLFEEWLAKRKKIPKLPPGARPGHGHNDSAVPLFPAEKLGDYFVPLRNLGARYDDENLSQLFTVTVRKNVGNSSVRDFHNFFLLICQIPCRRSLAC